MSYEEEDTCHMRRRIHVIDPVVADRNVSFVACRLVCVCVCMCVCVCTQ